MTLARTIQINAIDAAGAVPRPHTAVIKFIEGTRIVAEDELQANSMTRHHVTNFYREQITNSGHYEQLKYIVDPSLKEFDSSGSLDTSREHDNTVVLGLQHKYAQTGLLLVTDRCASYCRYCFANALSARIPMKSGPICPRCAIYWGPS
ncbi:hypothetical protein [Bradyrhizobium ganzhouense]|uniref:hypothetical protein n=1 Tax=Bradyrhizobium ganzhouense TaxID=1179767 RepID=UPI003CF0D586